jgi:tRNA (guanine37-N1)-methyltransferase
MRIDLLSIFPAMFEPVLGESILGRARRSGLVDIRGVDIRAFAESKHQATDDTPYGGGAGMVMKVEPIVAAIEAVVGDEGGEPDGRVIALLSATGRPFDQARAARLAQVRHLVLVAGRYEGVDERVCDYVDEEISIGDYVLTGGELAAMVVVDAVVRLLPGAVGNSESIQTESHVAPRLEYPHYTRPPQFAGASVPPVLLSGDHRRIADWRQLMSLRRTIARRPDLLLRAPLTEGERALLARAAERSEDEP